MSYGTGAYGVGAYGVGETITSGLFTVTPEPEEDERPPRARLEVTLEDDQVLQSVSVQRDGAPVRSRLATGGSVMVAYDYEAPYGEPVAYRARGSYLEPVTASWHEPWDDVSAWSGSGWTVSGGVARSTTPGSTITRDAGGVLERLVVAPPFSLTKLQVLDEDDVVLLQAQWTTGAMYVSGTSIHNTGMPPITEPFSITLRDGVARLRSESGAWQIEVGYSGTPVAVGLFRDIGINAEVGPLTAFPTAESAEFDITVVATVESSSAWLIHPIWPTDRSVCIDRGRWRDDGVNVDREAAGEVTRAASQHRFEVPGRARRVVNRTGVREDGVWPLVLLCPRLEDRDAVNELLRDQSPVLLRSPASWVWDLTDGWFSVGEVSEARVVSALWVPMRRMTLPLEPVEQPVGALVPEWTWAQVAAGYTWAQVRDRFATWQDLLLGEETT